ncbi:phosphoglycerate mutase-like protein [Mycena crocata]|nr:phosphoglycerate mutase-like protein [Mycena crocata]
MWAAAYSSFAVLTLFLSSVQGKAVSSFAGATSTFLFPPAGQTVTVPDPFFPNAKEVGFAGPTPTGDEANTIETAPSVAKLDSIFPLINPDTSDKPGDAFDVLHHLGNLAPWRSVKSFGLPHASARIPTGCKLEQVHLVHRHGARYPTTGAAPSDFATLLHGVADTTGVNVTGPLAFLRTWQYKLGAEILTPFGRSQLFALGVGFRVKYGELLKQFTDLPVFRTTSQGHMVDSALHFAAGFFGVQTYQQDYHQLIEVEAHGFNSTLASYHMCPNANNHIAGFGVAQGLQWATVYLVKAQKRLQPYITGITLDPSILLGMQQTCAYETVALGYSLFCDLFTQEEWIGYSYLNDLLFWYSFGPGNPAASAQGIGYVQELVSRLTETRITDFTSTVNETIVSSNVTFPFGQPIYVEATHDATISESTCIYFNPVSFSSFRDSHDASTVYVVLTAMNFTSLAANGPLPTDHIPPNHSYIVNNITPFASNLVGQVISCPASPASPSPTHIRWILNDAVVPLTGIKGCHRNSNGLCPLPTFIAGMQQRIAEVDFAFDCFANYTMPNPDCITTGQYPK